MSSFRFFTSRQLWLSLTLSLIKGQVLETTAAHSPTVQTEIKPERIVEYEEDGRRHYFIDFGKTWFGRLRVTFRNTGSATQGISFRSSEAVVNDDICEQDELCHGARQYRISLSAGPGISTDEQTGDDLPIRAVRTEMPSGEVTVDTAGVVLLARHVPFDDQASSFTCSNPTLVDVWDLCKHSVKATSFMGVYIDGVRELKPYEGDAYINMLSHYGVAANPPIARYTHEYLLDNHTWPWEYPVMSILMAWEDYMESGDDSSIRENYSKLKACVQVGDSEGLAEGAMVDWPRSIRNLYYEGGGRNSVTSGWIYRHLNVWAAIEELMGNHEQAEQYRTRAELTKRKMVEKLFDPNRGLYTDAERSDNVSVYGNAYPLAFGCFPEEHIPGVVTFLKARGMQCNVFAAQFLLDGLFDAGAADYAIELMSAASGNSWGHMLYDVGATITMEVWDPSQKGNLDWNHAWGAAPGNIIPRRLFGIMPIQPGYREFEVKPRVGSLTAGSYRLPTLAGEIAVSFTSAPGEHLKLSVTVPENSSGKVCLPRFNMSNSSVTLDGASVQGIPEGDFVYVDSLSPGTHTVERGTRTSVPLVSGGVIHSRPSIPLVTVHNRRLRIDVADGDPGRKYTVNIGTVDGRRNARFAATGNKSRYWVAARPGCYVVTIGDEDGRRILRKVVPVN